MQVVAMSNHKLNNDIYSSRSLSIHRRILVKNLLTLLYEMNPMLDWFDDGSGYDVGMYEGDDAEVSSSEPLLAEDEQNGWIEQTLSAAGLSDEEEDDVIDRNNKTPGRSEKSKTTSTPTTTPTTATATRTTPSNSTKSMDGRGSGSDVSQSTPSIKTGQNASDYIPTPPPPTRPAQTSSSSISSVIPSFPPAPTNRAYPPPSTPAAPASSVPLARASPSPSRTTYTLSPPSSSSSASSTTSSSSNASYTSSSSSGTLPMSGKAPLPRPKSIELPQSLNNYLSAAFDVDWSVELPTMEDSLFTSFKGSSSSPSSPGISLPGTSYLNGSLLSSAPKRRSFSSSTSTISSSSSSTLSKLSTTSSSSSLSSVDSWNKSLPFAVTETTTSTTATTPRGTVTSGEIMVAKSVQQPYHGNNNASLVSRAAGGGTTGSTKTLPPIRHDTQQRMGSTGPVPMKGGAVPRANDGQNALKATTVNSDITKNNNSNSKHTAPATTSTSSPKQTTRKTTLVPGRRSSLLHTGQMPSASGTKKSPTYGSVVVGSNTTTPTTVTITRINTINSSAIPTSSTSPASPPPSTSFASGYLSTGKSNNAAGGVHCQQQQQTDSGGFSSGSGSGAGSPSIARRTSSLQPMERLAPAQNSSSETVTSSAALPRPLLAKNFSSPIVIGAGGAPLPSTTTAGGSGYYDSHHSHCNNIHPINGFSAGGFPVVNAQCPPQAPRKLAVMPPKSPPTGPSNTSNFMPLTPPRSPSRGASAVSISSYVLTPAPALSSMYSSSSSASGAPILPPLFPVPNEGHKSSGSPISPNSRRSPPPTSPSSPSNGPLNHQYHQQQQQQQRQQHLSPPYVYTRSNSDDQSHSRSTPTPNPRRSPPPSPPPSSSSPSPTGSNSSTATSLSQASQPLPSTTAARSAAGYGMNGSMSKSSPNLTTGLSSDWYVVNTLGCSPSSSELLAHRPLPSLPQHYQPYAQQQQQSYTYQPKSQHPQRQQSYSYGGSDKELKNYKSGITSAPLPRITMSPPVAGSSGGGGGGHRGGSSSNRWATMKTMFSLKTTTSHGGK
ncbi:hypothetical protein BGZ96_008297 [Linnemannia gamsii]|uniref:Uncharacterized protein n=1 Tax=Linnemannia gamsii TaxID=64522 RepID=A0ABQ7JYU8_9FUNG|nr:hypothetical protein BGZ96_008297 [Linnemannia gamsii]